MRYLSDIIEGLAFTELQGSRSLRGNLIDDTRKIWIASAWNLIGWLGLRAPCRHFFVV